jgi:preprotein translocase subunit SecA
MEDVIMHSKLFTYILGSKEDRDTMRLLSITKQINAKASWAGALKDEDFLSETEKLKARLSSGEKRENVRTDAFALAREASFRVLGYRPFDVQVMGALALDEGSVAEMKTGEGKTLVCVMPAYFNSLSGKNVHVITVNEYLAKRDAEWMGKIYKFLGASVGVIYSGINESDRKEAYKCDITYGTNSEFAFDYLRDNMQYSPDDVVQRGFHYAVVDEADSILIDEARTPLIISGEGGDDSALCRAADSIAMRLREVTKIPGTNRYPDELLDEIPVGDYTLDENHKKASLTKDGMAHVEQMLHQMKLIKGSMYDTENFMFVHYVIEALCARYIYRKDKDYIVHEGEVLIVDEFTGRVLIGRRYSDGLHEAIEAKEHVQVRKQTRTFASISYQNFFRMYEKLSGMTGTAISQADELLAIYGLDVIVVPTNMPMIRSDEDDAVFDTEKEKWKAVCDEIVEAHKKGQPVLAGTSSVQNSELLASLLTIRGIPYDVLNAKNNVREAAIIAQAGKKGSVTIATNMAGRGTDIKLGGNPEAYKGAYDEVREAGGLYVIGTERYESKRIDNQLRGRSGRQGDPGKSRFFISREDDLFRRFPNNTRISASSAQAQIERNNFDIRKRLLEFDDVLNDERTMLYDYRHDVLNSDKDEGIKIPLLTAINSAWADHLEALDSLKEGVYLRSYAQKNPVVEFKIDASEMFDEMMESLKKTEEEFEKAAAVTEHTAHISV